jgi:hypothetical protein
MKSDRPWLSACLLLIAVALPVTGRASDALPPEEPDPVVTYPRLLERYGDAVVRLEYVATFSMFGQEQKQTLSASGLLVGDDGLLLVSDQAVRPRFPGMAGSGDGSMEIKSGEFRARFGSGDDDVEATLITRDGDLGLAWFRLASVPDGHEPVDLSARAEIGIGGIYYAVTRAPQALGSVPIVSHGVVVGKTDVPVPALLAVGPMDAAFDAEGRFVGFVTYNFDFANSASVVVGVIPQPMIPAARVARATAQAAALEDAIQGND